MLPLPIPRPLALLAAAALLLSAGCLGDEPAAEPMADGEAPAPDGASDPSTPPGEAPVDTTRGPSNANGTGDRAHLHDYWAGKERVVLFDGEVDASQVDPFGASFARLWLEKQPMVGGVGWLLPDGTIVFEGTGALEITATWSDPAITSLGVSYRSAASQEFSPFNALASSKTFSIEVAPEMTDMPHMSTSRWAFFFAPQDAPGVALGTFSLKVEIVKMRDVSLFPAHPDLFEGKPEKVLHDLDHAHEEVSYAKRIPNLLLNGQFGEKEVRLASLVPMETVWMRVEIDIQEATAFPGEVGEIRFFYRGADRSFVSHPTVLPIEGGLAEKRLVYSFPVTMEETDTPYGKESQWHFFVEPASKFTGQEQEPTCGGCTDVSIKYHLKVIAYSYEPDMPQSKLEGE